MEGAHVMLAASAVLLAGALAAVASGGTEDDYGRAHIGGNKGPIEWQSMLRGDGLEGWDAGAPPWSQTAWSLDGNGLVADADGAQQARLVQGDSTWSSYEFKVQATLVHGSNLEIHFGVQDSGHSIGDSYSGFRANSGDEFGYGFGIRTERGAHDGLESIGSFGWDGALYSRCWIDPQEDLFYVFLAQSLGSWRRTDLMNKLRVLVYQAIDD